MNDFFAGFLSAKGFRLFRVQKPPCVDPNSLPPIVNYFGIISPMLARLYPDTKDLIIKQFIALDFPSRRECLRNSVDMMIEKCIADPDSANLCMEVIHAQIRHELKTKGSSLYHKMMLARLQEVFNYDGRLIRTRDIPIKEQRLRLINLIAQLYVNQLATRKLIRGCMQELLGTLAPRIGKKMRREDVDEEAVTHGFELLDLIGKYIDKEPNPDFLDVWCEEFLRSQPRCTVRIQLMIHDFMETRARGYVPKQPMRLH